MASNLDLVRSICTAWERGDYSSADWAHPEIELVIADGPAPGSWIGLAGMAEAIRGWLSTWQELRQEPVGYRELDEERVLEFHRYSGRAKKSGVDVGQMRTRGARLFRIRNGKVTRLVLYWDGERALADLGLAPEASSAGT